MKNNFFKIFYIFIFFFFFQKFINILQEQFNFDVTEIEINRKWKFFKETKRW